MPCPSVKLTVTLFLFLTFAFQLTQTAEAGVTVGDRELVSKTRAGRTAFLYTYRITIENVGTTLSDVKVYVSCDNPGTTLVDDIVELGDIPENQTTTSTDTFSFRQDRRQPFDPDCLIYEVGFATTLIVSGTATDDPLPNAIIIGKVTRPDSGRPIIESGRPIIETFGTVADADGNYTLEMEVVTEDDFITLEAQGVAGQEDAVLTSSVGSAGLLQEQGSSGSIVVDSGDNGATNLTHITTAQDELVRRANGGVLPTNDGELAALQSQINGAELLTIASVIKTVIDNPGTVVLPPGVDDTLALIQDPTVFEDFLEVLETDPILSPLLATATQETAEALSIGFSPAEVPGKLYTTIRREVAFGKRGRVFDFDPIGGGTVILGNGSSDITWTVNSDDELEVDLLNPPVTETFVFREDPVTGPFQVRALQSVDSIRLIRLANGLVVDQVFILETILTTFPDNPLPDEFDEEVPGPDLVYVAFGNDGILPITADDIAGDQIATYYFHENNESVGINNPILGADFLTFEEDGTGSTARRGFSFGWSNDADGSVNIDFANGDSNQVIVYSEDGDIAQTLVIGTLASTGVTQVLSAEAASFDGVSDFSEPNLVNHRYRGLFAVFGFDLDVFDFLFLPGGDGCRQSPGAQRITWEATPEDRMDSFLFANFDPSTPFQRRGWQAIDMEPGLLGDRYWVIENLDVNGAFDPNFEFTDPTITPGRINAYEFIEDLTGQFDPCGLGSSNSLTTLFLSNNGAVGNMFDVTTNNGPVLITGLDVNVDFTVGTPFTISVFTVPGSFNDTITAPPACTSNCAFDASAWTLVSTASGAAQGRDQPSFVDIDDIELAANSQTGFWVTLARDGSVSDEFRYTQFSVPVDASDANIAIDVGAAVTGQVGAESVARTREWNGTIYYDTR